MGPNLTSNPEIIGPNHTGYIRSLEAQRTGYNNSSHSQIKIHKRISGQLKENTETGNRGPRDLTSVSKDVAQSFKDRRKRRLLIMKEKRKNLRRGKNVK